MTEAESIARECERRGVVLTVGEKSSELAFDAPAGAMSPELRAALAEHKPELIELLAGREERAALQDAPEWMDAGLFAEVAEHPAFRAMSAALWRAGFGGLGVVGVRRDRREAAA